MHVALADNSTAIVSLRWNNEFSLNIQWLNPQANDFAVGQFYGPYVIPSLYFGATSCGENATAVCMYYQHNGTAVAELEYDRFEQQWHGPSYISF